MKKKTVLIIAIFFCLNILVLHFELPKIKFMSMICNVYAQPKKPKFPYKKYGDRKEGLIINKKKLVSGKVNLISALLENQEIIHDENIPQYNLGFYSSDSAKIKIEVWEYNHYYKMEPLRKTYNPGIHTFSWPSAIPLYYDIGLNDLFPLAKTRGSEGQKIIPIILYYQKPHAPSINYKFSLISNTTIIALEYKIYKLASNEPIFTARRKDLPGDKIFHIRWNGKDNQNNPVPTDLLILNIKATFKSKIRREVILNYHFYHFADLLKQKEFSIK